MGKKIVLAIDSYKGCLSSLEVETAVARGIRKILPNVEICSIPIADGGEGMLEVMLELTNGRKVEIKVHDALMRPVDAYFGVLGDGETAVVEMAQACGLPLLKMEERNPMQTTSYGTGEIIRRVISEGYRRIIVGLGGSATNDAGMGMMQALGAHFFDQKGWELKFGCGRQLGHVADISVTEFEQLISGVDFVVACDVNNPFCGPQGAAHVFAPQKGATATMVKDLDEGMFRFAQQVLRVTGKDIRVLPGSGAAGGMGGCFYAFFSSSLCPGIDLILKEMNFRQQLDGAVLLITGEGKSDCQTLMGKVPAGVLKVGKELGIDVVLFSGDVVESEILLSAGFSKVIRATPMDMPLDIALQPEVAVRNIEQAVKNLLF